jgi:hypothetical protein
MAGYRTLDDRGALVVAVQLAAQLATGLRELKRNVLHLAVSSRDLSNPDA